MVRVVVVRCIAGGVVCSMRVWAIADAHYDDRGVGRVGGPIFLFYFLGYRVGGCVSTSPFLGVFFYARRRTG